MSDDRPTFGSLFAGIGGIDLGLERAGWECRFQVEWDPFCQRVLAEHWPDVQRYGDITTVDWSGVERVDLLAGGFPCQPVSSAGKGQAQDDVRWLWPEFARAIRALRPGLVLVENVPGLLVRGFGDVLGDLATLGYDAEWDCIPAASVGAPHLRDRVWIVAYPRCLGSQRRRVFGELVIASGAGAGEASERQRVRDTVGDRGTALAYAHGGGRSTRRLHVRRERPDEDATAKLVGSGEGMAHADSRRREPGSGWQEVGRLPEPDSSGDPRQGGSVVGDAAGTRTDPRTTPRRSRSATSEPGRRPTKPGLVGAADGLSGGLDGHRWPAPPGPQFDWEPPRTVVGQDPARARRLSGLGNAVVPQVVEMIGAQLLASLRAIA